MSSHSEKLKVGQQTDDALFVTEWQQWIERRSSPMHAGMIDTAGSLAAPPCPIPLLKRAPRLRTEREASDVCIGIAASEALSATCEALLRWNSAIITPERGAEDALLAHARWLVDYEVTVAPGAGGWPLPVADTRLLSATMQGLALAVLARAYLLTGQIQFLACARRAAHTFALDILDGGVCAPVGDGEDAGIVFEAVARYPADHSLEGFLVATLSLYDFATLTDDTQARALAQRGHDTLHKLLPVYDVGYRTRSHLHGARLSGQCQQAYLARLMDSLAACSRCAQCQRTSTCWAMYPRSATKRLRFHLARARNVGSQKAWALARHALGLRGTQTNTDTHRPYRICVPITAYPVGGGMRAVMAGWRQAMACDWTMEFLTAHIGPDAEGQVIYSFDPRVPVLRARAISPSLFPNVIGYVLAGLVGLHRLLRRAPDYKALLPQDGVYTAAFAAICAKLTGQRLVIVDHGNVRDLYDPDYAAEHRQRLARFFWPKRQIAKLRLALYFPTVRALARFASRYGDHILAASDDIVESYRRHLGVPAHRITRFPFMLDTTRYTPFDEETRARQRVTLGLPEDAIVIAMVNRLHPMKGVDVGVSALRAAIAALPSDIRARVRILIVGDGELREQVTAAIHEAGLEDICRMWGEARADEVALLLRISDIFLFSARRSINSMAVLEAMAAGCATVATVTSPHIAEYLADLRGMTTSIGDVDALADALGTLTRDDTLRQEMGARARDYVVAHHTGEAVRRHLLRATYWQPEL